MNYKKCKECQKLCPESSFKYMDKGRLRERRKCEECFKKARRERQRKWIENNREKHNAKARDYRNKRYATDPDFREREKREARETYAYLKKVLHGKDSG